MAMEKYLIINPGSASNKYALFNEDGQKLSTFHFERENSGFVVTISNQKKKIKKEDYDNALKYVVNFLKEEIRACAVRIVAPGEYFSEDRLIDKNFINKLERQKDSAPLHIGPELEEIKKIKKILPKTKLIAVSDSAFYKNLPEKAKYYGLPKELEIRRFGYHGISMASILNKLKKLGKLPKRTIVCHLGSGSSITAVLDGHAIDTSMGFTPLEGLLMATRPGDIDVGALIYLAKKKKFNFSQLEEYLNTKCGLLGLSGKTSDIRELLKLEKKGDKDAKLALEIFVYRIQKYIGSYITALGGLDLLVFTATIGERSSIMRGRILKGLKHFGKFDVKIVPTSEGEEMFRQLRKFL